MAKWLVFENTKKHLRFYYCNPLTGACEKLGDMRPDTPDDLILEWWIKVGEPSARDILVIGRRVWLYTRPTGEA